MDEGIDQKIREGKLKFDTIKDDVSEKVNKEKGKVEKIIQDGKPQLQKQVQRLTDSVSRRRRLIDDASFDGDVKLILSSCYCLVVFVKFFPRKPVFSKSISKLLLISVVTNSSIYAFNNPFNHLFSHLFNHPFNHPSVLSSWGQVSLFTLLLDHNGR